MFQKPAEYKSKYGFEVVGNEEIAFEEIVTDSREAGFRKAFVAIEGKRVDGHNFIDEAYRKGSRVFIVSSEKASSLVEKYKDWLSGAAFMYCSEKRSDEAVELAARKKFSEIKGEVVGITGSSGKTTVKEMISSLLSTKYETFKTRKSYNTPLGLSVEILNASPNADYYVFEYGVSKEGDMEELLRIALPTKAVITNIGYAHLGIFGSREKILKEKIKLAQSETVGEIYVNTNTDYLEEIFKLLSDYNARVYTAGKREEDDLFYKIVDVDQVGYANVQFRYRKKEFELKMSVPGIHNVENFALAVLVALKASVEVEDILKAAAELRLPKMRLEILRRGKFIFINDAYNSNPASLKAALEFLFVFSRDSERKKVAVLGDMLELGKKAGYYHEQAGEIAKKMGVEKVIYIGEYAEDFLRGYAQPESFIHVMTAEGAARALKKAVSEEAVVLLKASRALALERVLDYV